LGESEKNFDCIPSQKDCSNSYCVTGSSEDVNKGKDLSGGVQEGCSNSKGSRKHFDRRNPLTNDFEDDCIKRYGDSSNSVSEMASMLAWWEPTLTLDVIGILLNCLQLIVQTPKFSLIIRHWRWRLRYVAQKHFH
jgi:hypothetical protein